MAVTCVWFIVQGNQGQIWNQLIEPVVLIYNMSRFGQGKQTQIDSTSQPLCIVCDVVGISISIVFALKHLPVSVVVGCKQFKPAKIRSG